MTELTDDEITEMVNSLTLEQIHQKHLDDKTRHRVVNKMAEMMTGHKINECEERFLNCWK